MSEFRDLVADMDGIIFDALTDDVTIKGIAVEGLFSAPWLDPGIGRLDTGITEPHILVRDADAAGVDKGDPVVANGGAYEVVGLPEPDGTGCTVLVLRPAA